MGAARALVRAVAGMAPPRALTDVCACCQLPVGCRVGATTPTISDMTISDVTISDMAPAKEPVYRVECCCRLQGELRPDSGNAACTAAMAIGANIIIIIILFQV